MLIQRILHFLVQYLLFCQFLQVFLYYRAVTGTNYIYPLTLGGLVTLGTKLVTKGKSIYWRLKLGHEMTCHMPNSNKKQPSYGISKMQCAPDSNQSNCRPGPVDPTVLGLQITVFFLTRDFLPHASSNLSPCMLQPSYSRASNSSDRGGCLLDHLYHHHESKWMST